MARSGMALSMVVKGDTRGALGGWLVCARHFLPSILRSESFLGEKKRPFCPPFFFVEFLTLRGTNNSTPCGLLPKRVGKMLFLWCWYHSGGEEPIGLATFSYPLWRNFRFSHRLTYLGNKTIQIRRRFWKQKVLPRLPVLVLRKMSNGTILWYQGSHCCNKNDLKQQLVKGFFKHSVLIKRWCYWPVALSHSICLSPQKCLNQLEVEPRKQFIMFTSIDFLPKTSLRTAASKITFYLKTPNITSRNFVPYPGTRLKYSKKWKISHISVGSYLNRGEVDNEGSLRFPSYKCSNTSGVTCHHSPAWI